MSEEETFDVLENKPSDFVTTDELEKKGDLTSVEVKKPPDDDKKVQDDEISVASELRAESSEKYVSHELQIDSGECSIYVELHNGPNPTSSENQNNRANREKSHTDISDKMKDISLSSKEKIPTRPVGVQNQTPSSPSHEHLSSSPNKVHIDSSDIKQDDAIAPVLDHKDFQGRRTAESITETYDVISRKDVQDFNEWESIHRDCHSEIPPIDPGALQDIEKKAREVARNLDHLMGTLNASLKSLSVIGVQSLDTYKTTVENVETTVDTSIKSMCTLIAKCEELHSYMGPLYSMSAQIKDIKRTLDVFESLCK